MREVTRKGNEKEEVEFQESFCKDSKFKVQITGTKKGEYSWKPT